MDRWEHIVPISPQAARDWAEESSKRMSTLPLFGEPEEAADGRETLQLVGASGVKRKQKDARGHREVDQPDNYRRICLKGHNKEPEALRLRLFGFCLFTAGLAAQI